MAQPIDPRVVELNSRIFQARLTVKRVLQRAKVPGSTWWRWVTKGSDPRRETIRKVSDAIDSLTSEKDDPNGGTRRQDDAPSVSTPELTPE